MIARDDGCVSCCEVGHTCPLTDIQMRDHHATIFALCTCTLLVPPSLWSQSPPDLLRKNIHVPTTAFTPASPWEASGDRHYRKAEYPMARMAYENIPANSLTQSEARRIQNKLALTYLQTGKPMDSLPYLEGSKDYSSRLLQLYAFMRSGMQRSVHDEYQAIEAMPDLSDHDRSYAKMLFGTLYLEQGEYDAAKEFYARIQKESEDPLIRSSAGGVINDVMKYQEKPRKSLLLAGSLSALLPGAGQIYSDHTADGITAFFYNFVFLGGAAGFYSLENRAHRPHTLSLISGGIGLFFYIANITGGIASAKRYNIFQERQLQEKVRKSFFNVEFVEKGGRIRFTFPLDEASPP